jgi:hypothetical protein
MTEFFADRTALLATMHGKERVIAPVLAEVGLRVQVPQGLDTDQFGTFTRDRDRPGTQLETARLKAQRAMALTGEDLAISSEGSFGPHPSLPGLACDRELVLLLDRVHDLEIVGEVVVLETNFRHQTIRSVAEAMQFAQQVGFPSHGLMVMAHAAAKLPTQITKGITTEAVLQRTVAEGLAASPTGSLHLETDMRAMMNPTRMAAIAQATHDLLSKLKSLCPQCGMPGFQVVERRIGLPCQLCQLPTGLVRSHLYGCQRCDCRQERLFPEGQQAADPMYCGYCNP